MKIDILTLFPKMFYGPFRESLLKKAQEKGLLDIKIHNLRNWAKDKHKTVDDTSYGGGSGMIIKVDVTDKALTEIKSQKSKVKNNHCESSCYSEQSKGSRAILLSPQGNKFNQKTARRLSKLDHLILICGHYEGFDERIREHLIDEEISIGDYILTGGELPAMVVADTIARLIPGVVGKKESVKHESFSKNLLDFPVYTKPEKYRGWKVPKILLSGNHTKINQWRQKKSLSKTKKMRPDILNDK